MNRILLAYPEVSPLFLNGGIGTFVYEVARVLSKTRQWEIDILTDTTYAWNTTPQQFRFAADQFQEMNVRLIDLNRDEEIPCGWDSPDVFRAERYHRHVSRLHQIRHYDVIEFPDWRAPGFFVIRDKRTIGSFSDTSIVVHCHSSTKNVWDWFGGHLCDRNDFYCNYMENYSKKYADVVLSPSEFLLRDVYPTQNAFKKTLLRNGYPISALQDVLITTPDSRKSKTITVACVSRLERRKGQDVFGRAIRRLSESGLYTNVEYVFCGKDGLGKEADGLMSNTLKPILERVPNWKIIPPMNRADLISWLWSDVDICIVPSRQDNYPNVVLEAARSGCYVIASNAGGIPEIFEDYKIEGSLFKIGDDQELEKQIGQAISRVMNEPDIRKRIGSDFERNRELHEKKTVTTYDEIVQKNTRNSVISSGANESPRVSVVIPFFNAQKFARDAIRSAFASNYTNLEVILVNDGSDDPESAPFLREIESEFPSLKIIHKRNGGLGDARNAGLAVATGEFIVPLDSDNILLPNMLNVCSGVLSSRPNLTYVTTYYECLYEDGSQISWRLSPIAKPLGAIDPLLLLENPVGDALSMIRKKDIDEVGGYSTTIYCFEDWDLWLKFHALGKEGDVIPEILFIYRLRANSMSRRLDAKSGLRVHQALLDEHRDLVKDQSFAITTLLLRDYWQQWRSTQNLVTSPQPQLSWNRVRKGIKDPARAWRYLRKRIVKS